MNVEQEVEQRLETLLDQVTRGDAITVSQVKDVLRWAWYGQKVLSQFDMGLCGSVFRQSRTSVLMTVKAVESGVPLVAFVSSATTVGCVEHLFDLLYNEKLKWQKDKYPWI